MSLAEAEAILGDVHGEPVGVWVPPVGLGALPVSLEGRARGLVARQREVAGRVERSLVVTRKHSSAVRALRDVGEPVPVFVDRVA